MIKSRLERFRNFLKEQKLDAFIIPSNDTHFGEYIPNRFKIREWLSGFTGSAGTLVVTADSAALWTDSRYFLQARDQLSGSGIELVKLRVEGEPTLSEWLKTQFSNLSTTIGIDEALFSWIDYSDLSSKLSPLVLKPIKDPFDLIWDNRESLIFNHIDEYSIAYTGQTTSEKLKNFRTLLNLRTDFVYFSTACDDNAWIFNIRGSDIQFNPLPLTYAVITNNEAILFCNLNSIDDSLKLSLEKEGVEILPYADYTNIMQQFDPKLLRVGNLSTISYKDYLLLTKNSSEFLSDKFRGGVISHLKSRKNQIEIDGFRKAHILDAIAWVKYLIYIEESIKHGIDFTEWQLTQKFIEFKRESTYYVAESFAPIVASGENGASPHYEPKESSKNLIKDGVLLTDSGSHYLFGTTDTTRTICLGHADKSVKTDFTYVLKGLINLSKAVFPKGSRGSSLDILARGEVCKSGKLYLHGTGHGVGHYLPVHEGPQSIRMEENPVTLEVGMVQSNEPAIYVEGEYGIRTENLILVKLREETRYGSFYEFETLTFVPIEKSLIDKSLMNSEEIIWLNAYHTSVYEKLSPYLSKDSREWLKLKCSPLD